MAQSGNRRNSAGRKTTAKTKTANKAKTRSARTNAKAAQTVKDRRKVKKNEEPVKNPVVREKYIPTEKEIKIRNEIKLLISLLVSILLVLANFGLISPVGDYISYFMFGLVGVFAYILPIVVFIGVAFVISNKDSRKGMIKFAAATTLFVLLCGMIQLFMLGKSETITGYYKWCGSNKAGGGIIGGLIAKGLYNVVGLYGAVIVLVILIIIALMIITEKSFIGGVRNGGKKVYTAAMDDVNKIKENVKDMAEEKRYNDNRRINKKFRGVAITHVGDGRDKASEMREINVASADSVASNNVFRGHVDVNELVNFPQSEDTYRAEYNFDDLREIKRGPSNDKTSYANAITYSNADTYVNAESYVNTSSYTRPNAMSVQESVEGIGNVSNSFNHFDVPSEHTSYVEEVPQVDEEGFFKPKEQIFVSKEATETMKRKPFSNGEPVKASGEPDMVEAPRPEPSFRQTAAYAATNELAPKKAKKKEYTLPKTTLLNKPAPGKGGVSDIELANTAQHLRNILHEFGVNVTVNNYSRGPSVTRYELQPETGTRLSKITSLADDIKLNLAATDIRIEAPIPGKSAVGIEVPNKSRETVYIKDLIESPEIKNHPSMLAFPAGKDIAGKVIVADIAKMPHMLIAGTTGSGKSVFTNSIIMTILFRAKPSDVRLIIIDPKVVEFGIYNGIPHLLQPVVTDPKLASNTLKWAVNEMSERYKKFADMNVRDLKGYNARVAEMAMDESIPESEKLEKLPQILIVIDELADLMMVAAKEVEESICRLAQLARAAGIHLIIATQRPSVDVVTGLIKANIPSRTALMVSSGVDSRTIIDSVGAEKLLGNGDMLFYPAGYVKPVRLQGAFVSDGEVSNVVSFWKNQAGNVTYDTSITEYVSVIPQASNDKNETSNGYDEYFAEAGRFIIDKDKASISSLQRVFKIGFNRAARIIDQLEEAGVVSAEDGTKPRNVLMTKEEFENIL